MTGQARTRSKRNVRPFTVTLNDEIPRIVVSQRNAETNGAGPQGNLQRVVTLEGRRASQYLPLTMDLLGKAGADVVRLGDNHGGRVQLAEDRGARLALTLACVAPVRKPSRAALIRAGISEMSNEEVYYWYARMASEFKQNGNNALKALRILLAGE